MTAVAPVLVARSIGRCNSSERMPRDAAGAASIAIVSPNQPMLLRLAKIVGAVRGVGEARRELLAEQVLVADVGRDALAADVERRRGAAAPRSKSPSGMFIIRVNQ